jgi:putative transcriptional regulator
VSGTTGVHRRVAAFGSEAQARREIAEKQIDMAIIINIDVMLARRKMSVTELAERVGITMANISVLKNGKAKAIRLSTLEAVCTALDCQPGDILEYRK